MWLCNSSASLPRSQASIVCFTELSSYTLESLHNYFLPGIMSNRVKIELSANDIIQVDLSSAIPSMYHTPSRGDVPQP